MKEKRKEITKKIKLFWNRHRVVMFHLKYNKIWGQGQFWCLPYPVLSLLSVVFPRTIWQFSTIHGTQPKWLKFLQFKDQALFKGRSLVKCKNWLTNFENLLQNHLANFNQIWHKTSEICICIFEKTFYSNALDQFWWIWHKIPLVEAVQPFFFVQMESQTPCKGRWYPHLTNMLVQSNFAEFYFVSQVSDVFRGFLVFSVLVSVIIILLWLAITL